MSITHNLSKVAYYFHRYHTISAYRAPDVRQDLALALPQGFPLLLLFGQLFRDAEQLT